MVLWRYEKSESQGIWSHHMADTLVPSAPGATCLADWQAVTVNTITECCNCSSSLSAMFPLPYSHAGKQARGAAWQRRVLLDLQDETAFSSTELQVKWCVVPCTAQLLTALGGGSACHSALQRTLHVPELLL